MQRTLTVSYLPGHSDDVPYLRLQGNWLRMVGFPVGCQVTVTVDYRKLIITPKDVNHDPNPVSSIHNQTTKNDIPNGTSTGTVNTGWQADGPSCRLPGDRTQATNPQSPNEKDQ